MKRKLLLSLYCAMALVLGCTPKSVVVEPERSEAIAAIAVATFDDALRYSVDLNNIADDQFKVTLDVDDLTEQHAIYQFASTAPGTYQRMDVGRYVRDFKAFDEHGVEIAVSRASTNQWELSKPAEVRRITYGIAETWDTKMDELPIYPMAGTSIEKEHVQLLAHAVFGYPTGMQARPLKIHLEHPEHWLVGSALNRDGDNDLIANNYDHAVDSPILLGELTYASREYKGGLVEVFTYSKSGKTTSQELLDETWPVVESVGAFLKGFPVERYTFLYLLEDRGVGAWEHSYSSNYAIPDGSMDSMRDQLSSIVAHEIFHIVTPLNIHSEIIEQFNFVQPVPSRHLWLYEATTEWAAHIMRLRSGNLTLDAYFEMLNEKFTMSGYMPAEVSLTELSLNSYEPAGARQYPNIYMRGALTVGLLDLRLLELSDGKRGLREVLLELATSYGKEKAFSDAHFFDDFVVRTYPEIEDFFKRYVIGHEPLPVAEFYAKLGIIYTEEVETAGMEPWWGFDPSPMGHAGVAVLHVSDQLTALGLADHDLLVSVAGITLDEEHMNDALMALQKLKAGDKYKVEVKRGEDLLKLELVMLEKKRQDRHVFALDPQASASQTDLRAAWQKNL